MQRLIVAGSITFLPLALSAQVLPDSGALVVTLGRDTIAVERFVRTPTRFEMVGLSRVPQTRMVRMVVSWNDAGKLTAYEVLNFAPPGGRGGARIRTVGKVVGDSVEVEMSQGDGPARVRRIPGGADVPFVNPFYSAYETTILRARANRAATVPLLGQAGLIAYNAVWSADTVTLTHPDFGTLRAVTDGSGHISVLNGAGTTFKVDVRSATAPDIEALAAQFAQRDAAGRALGLLSPRDTAQALIGGGTMKIDYGRPSVRGRVIFGDVVPWGRIWRTGANAATQLETTRVLVIDGVIVPAGKYTLFTIPGRGRWQLVINKQTGQWGTVYDERQDLARIPVRTELIKEPIEQLTITIEPTVAGGVITLSWEKTRVVVPFTVL